MAIFVWPCISTFWSFVERTWIYIGHMNGVLIVIPVHSIPRFRMQSSSSLQLIYMDIHWTPCSNDNGIPSASYISTYVHKRCNFQENELKEVKIRILHFVFYKSFQTVGQWILSLLKLFLKDEWLYYVLLLYSLWGYDKKTIKTTHG